MANEKILIFEAPWFPKIEDTQATRDIYASAETLLRIGPQPIRIIQRPLVSTTYLDDIEKFVDLECNQKGPNVIIFSAHGSHTFSKENKNRRKIKAFDRSINISVDIRCLKEKLGRTIIVLDSCEIGKNVGSFRRASGSLATLGFTKDVDWVDSSVFILALLLHFQQNDVFQEDVFSLKRARKSTRETESKTEKTIKKMLEGTYKSFKKPLGIIYSFR